MNPLLDLLQPYPFQKLAALFKGVQANPDYKPVSLHIGEPKHPTPQFICDALTANLNGLANYPTTLGSDALRGSIAGWIQRRYQLPANAIDPKTQVVPVNGSREALFSFAQAVIDRSRANPVVISPNPFYQIYEGAALLAGATPHFLNTVAEDNFALNFDQLSEEVWQRTQLIYVCSPGNPNGHVMPLSEWKTLFEMSDRYGFVIAADECYSEIYFDTPPLGALEAAQRLGRGDFRNLVIFSSLSKRSNVPGLRSGFVAGDAKILEKFTLYRTYHGCAMNPAVQAASIAAWNDEAHVAENRRLYQEKFSRVVEILKPVLPVVMPDASFYLWLRVPFADTTFAQELHRDYNVTVLPGSFLAREVRGTNPGENYVRIALVAPLEETLDAARRIAKYSIKSNT
ncbi:MAG: succinyldiaminopimelate transaminase [Gallionellales bacterium 35-53-114]|jgi:N-succinyldiaminopimelate aminotransferase|nr:MAG: succinyldiaminopimelate transaminase [Gallionellales bacterium 35-53-114]OYZ64706.1 MAG: succinyldiaminopimelate transaminase [Gallionellales bacterium 24-53-125]OZB07755.1 MAG: succinyldiaminopimelate transaminase [Gallionellales bacterium 39-52-133]HQS58538.1 succinyldiaminopimelate transaminase [Gallionellaceae bacterium]HQS74879.1 succinyldiaminopimelate transaminase [Gallionellaceae bacterium]